MSREKVWVVRAGDGDTLLAIVRRAGEPNAIAEGRAFVGKKRAARDQPVKVGDTIRIGRPARRTDPTVPILFGPRDGIIAVDKPPGIATVPDRAGAHSLVATVARELGTNVEALVVTSRLDREVSGVVVFALDARAAERLKDAREHGLYQRRYVAIGEGALATTEGMWVEDIGRRATEPRLRAVNGPDAKQARTRWQVVGHADRFYLLAVEPQTGRTHQIRVHVSHAGAPLLGDRDYGGSSRIVLATGAVLAPTRIALHAARVTVPGALIEAPIPKELEEMWARLGGAPEAWNRALACDFP